MKRSLKYFALIAAVIVTAGLFTIGRLARVPQPTLRSLYPASELIARLSFAHTEQAMKPYNGKDAIRVPLREYADIMDGRDVTRCDCVDYEVTGEDDPPGNYTETLRFKLTLSDGSYLYAETFYQENEYGNGTPKLTVLREEPW